MKKIVITIIVLAAVAAGGYYYMQSTGSAGSTMGDAMQAIEPTPTGGTETGAVQAPTGTAAESGAGTKTGDASYTMADLSAHNSAASCWSAINGNVYDLTAWIGKHPGGEKAITQLCGKDGSAEFNGQHGGAMRQANTLAGFKIGVLAQ